MRGIVRPATVQDQERLFFEQLGRAIGKWQLVEMQLFRVYARLARCESAEVASAAFHSIIGFRVRLEMTDAAAQTALTGERLSSWDSLRNRTNRQSKRRNLLAHFVVTYGVNRPTLPEHGPFLQASALERRSSAGTNGSPYRRREDQGYGRRIWAFKRRAQSLCGFPSRARIIARKIDLITSSSTRTREMPFSRSPDRSSARLPASIIAGVGS